MFSDMRGDMIAHMEKDMVHPSTVDSPRANWTLLDVLSMNGGPNNDEWSLVLGRWRNEANDAHECLAMRWNGTHDPDSKGSPTSRGFPTWFIVPKEIEPNLMIYVPPAKRAYVMSKLARE